METGRPVSSRMRLSRFFSSAPPPVSTMPRSLISAESSGGVRSRATRTAFRIVATHSLKRFANFAVVDRDGPRHAFDQVAAFHFHGQRFFQRIRRADLHLDLFRGALADEQVVLALQVLHDRFVHLIAGDAHGTRVNDAAHGDDRDVRRAAADVHDHVAGRLFDRQARADGRSHGLLHQINFAGARAIRGVLHRALFHRRNFAGHSDDDARMHQHAAVVRLLNKIRQHFFGDFEVGDDAVLHGLDGHNVAWRAAEHLFGFAADGHDFVRWIC